MAWRFCPIACKCMHQPKVVCSYCYRSLTSTTVLQSSTQHKLKYVPATYLPLIIASIPILCGVYRNVLTNSQCMLSSIFQLRVMRIEQAFLSA